MIINSKKQRYFKMLNYTFLLLFTVFMFVNSVSNGYVVKNILLFTYIGIMLIPVYLLNKGSKFKLSRSFIIDFSLYLVMLITIYINSKMTNDITIHSAIIHGELPGYLSLQTYSYFLLFILIITPYIRELLNQKNLTIIASAHVILGVVIVIHKLYYQSIPLYFGFGNANYVGEPFAILYLLLILPMLLKDKWSNSNYILGFFMLYFAIYSNSRAIQVSLLIGVIVTIIVTALKKSSFKKHLLLIVFQLILVYTLNFIMTDFQSVVSFFDREGLNSISSSRIDIWRNIIEVTMSTKKNFLIGTGPSTFYYYGATNHNAHNMIVEIFGSMGIIGLSAFIVLCIRILYRTIILVIKRSEYVYLLGLLAFMTSKWMLNSMMALTSIYFALIIALIINNYNKENKTNDIN